MTELKIDSMYQLGIALLCLHLSAAGCSSDSAQNSSHISDAPSVTDSSTQGGSQSESDPNQTNGGSEINSVEGEQDAPVSDTFDGNGPLVGYITNNATALPDVVRKDGRYHATVLDNDDNITLHFNEDQGRLDAKKVSFPFEYIARNIGIGTLQNSQIPPMPDDISSVSNPFMFAGIQVHDLELDKRNSAHFVVGHRGSKSFTVEGKNTVNGKSAVNDAGEGIVPLGRADLRVVGTAERSLTWYWQQPNPDPDTQPDDWIAYRGDGNFPGDQAKFGSEVYIGLITYAWKESSVPFVGTCDSVKLVGEEN